MTDWEPTEWYDNTDPEDRGLRLQEEDTCKAWSDIGPGDRIRWKTQSFVKRGTVQSRDKRTMTVLFDSHSVATIIPDAKWYFVEGKTGNLNEHLVTISTPAPAESQAVTRKRRRDPSDSDWISPHDAANILGTDAKNIRRMIRSGKLPAMRDGGRWLVLRKNVERQ